MAKTVRRRITRSTHRPLPQKVRVNAISQSHFTYKRRRYSYTVANAEMEEDFPDFVRFLPEGKKFFISDIHPKDLRQYLLIHELLVHNDLCDDIAPNKQALIRLLGEIIPANLKLRFAEYMANYYKKLIDYLKIEKETKDTKYQLAVKAGYAYICQQLRRLQRQSAA